MKLILKLSLLVLILIFSASNSSAQKLDEYIQMWGHDIKWWRLATPQDVENQIQQGANVNDKDINGTTALMYAALNKNPQIIETFINYKADVNAKNEIGETALMTAAAFNQNPEVIDTLIKYKADVNAENENEETALMIASTYNKNPAIIKTLIKHGANVNMKDKYGNTSLMIAAKNKNLPAIRTLIKHGGDSKDNYKHNTLYIFIHSNITLDDIKTLIKEGIDINYKNLIDYNKRKNRDIIEMLAKKQGKIFPNKNDAVLGMMEYNDDLNVIEAIIKHTLNNIEDDRDKKSMKLLLMLYATHNRNPLVIQTLIKNGIYENLESTDYLNILNEASRSTDNPEIIEMLIKNGADVNAKDIYGLTALMEAAFFNINNNIIETLIKHGAKVNAKDTKGNTALMYALYIQPKIIKYYANLPNPRSKMDKYIAKKRIIIETLIKNGADVNNKNKNGCTPLMRISIPSLLETLIKNGADVNAKNNGGITALMHAVGYMEGPALIKKLIEYGADINAKDDYGRTALIFAAAGNKPDAIETLINNGANVNTKEIPLLIAAVSRLNMKEYQFYSCTNQRERFFENYYMEKYRYIISKIPFFYHAIRPQEENPNYKLATIDKLIQYGVDVNEKDTEGTTALMHAVKWKMNKPIIITTLIELGANINAKNNQGLTAVDLAEQHDRFDIIPILQEYNKKAPVIQ